MKKRNITWAVMPIATLCISLTGCSSDNTPETPEVVTKPFTISASLGTDNSRATVDYGTPDVATGELFKWNANDEFQLMAKDANGDIKNDQSKFHTFTIASDYVETSGSNSAKFTNDDKSFKPEGEFSCFALYPKEGYSENNGNQDFTVAAIQTQNGPNTNHLKSNMKMYANGAGSSTNGASLSFKHLTAMLRFTVTNANAADCKVKSITVTASANNVFGTNGRITPNETEYAQDPTITTITKAATLTLNMSDFLLAANSDVNGYALTLPGDALTSQKLTFTLTVTDANGSNERTYTSFVFSADKIGATTWEAGKRYWFNLTLDDQLTIGNVTVSDWGTGTPNGGLSSGTLSLSELCQSNTYKTQREAFTSLTLNGVKMTEDEKTNYMQGNFATYFPKVTTVNFTGISIERAKMFQGITQVTVVNGESLISLCSSAFEGSLDSKEKIEEFNLPNVKNVGSYCFKRCGVITTLSLPNMTWTGDYSFNYITTLKYVCFASMKNFTGTDIFGYSNYITDLAFGTTEQMTFSDTEKRMLGGPMASGKAAKTTLYLNENGYEYNNKANFTMNAWRGITFKEIKKYSEYTYKKD